MSIGKISGFINSIVNLQKKGSLSSVNDIEKEKSNEASKQLENSLEAAAVLGRTSVAVKAHERKEAEENVRWAVDIFNKSGIDTSVDENGYITISHFAQPDRYNTFRNLNIDENKLFERVKKVEGDCDWSNASISSAPNLESVGGNFIVGRWFKEYGDPLEAPEHLPLLKHVGGNLNIESSKLLELPSLESVGGNLSFMFTPFKSAPKLHHIMGDLDLLFADKLEELPSLKYVKGAIKDRGGTIQTALPKLSVAGSIDSKGKINDLSSLIYVIGDMNIKDNPNLTEIPLLSHVGGKLTAGHTLKSVPLLKRVDKGMDIDLFSINFETGIDENGYCTSVPKPSLTFPSLEKLGGYSFIHGARFVAPKLEEIESITTRDCSSKLITYCPNLKTIGGIPVEQHNFDAGYRKNFTYIMS